MHSESMIDGICTILKDRDLNVKRDAIAAALKDPTAGYENAEWLTKHLCPETLLSLEELKLYTKLENSGALHPILRDPDLTATRPVLEEDIRTAVKSLEASTAAIQQQQETLSLQCETLRKQLQHRQSLDQERNRDIGRLRKKHEAGRQHTTIAANELSDELEISFRSVMDKSGAENKRILSSLSNRLKCDDKVLSTMEDVTSGIKSHHKGTSLIKRTADLRAALADCTAKEIHNRLDRIYLEAIQTELPDSTSPSADAETITALREELESLHPEIEVLADLSTKQQFLDPILRGINEEHDHLRAASHHKLQQAFNVLLDMTLDKQALTKQLDDRTSSCEVLDQLVQLYQEEAGMAPVCQPPSRRESLRRRSMQPGMLFAAQKMESTAKQTSLESHLRRVGVTPESILSPRLQGGGAQELLEKRIHMSETIRGLGFAVELPLMAQTASSDSAVQLLNSSLHTNSHFESSLRDAGQENALSGLQSELAQLQTGVQGLKLDGLHQRDRAQERFLERWGER